MLKENRVLLKLYNTYQLMTFTSDESELSSARIQLELEDFQLGSARLVRFWAQLILQKI